MISRVHSFLWKFLKIQTALNNGIYQNSKQRQKFSVRAKFCISAQNESTGIRLRNIFWQCSVFLYKCYCENVIVIFISCNYIDLHSTVIQIRVWYVQIQLWYYFLVLSVLINVNELAYVSESYSHSRIVEFCQFILKIDTSFVHSYWVVVYVLSKAVIRISDCIIVCIYLIKV